MTAKKMLKGKGYRAASKAAGDDTTRARFVRVKVEGQPERKRRVHKPRLPGFEAPFILEGRAKFPKSVKPADEHILVSGHNNIKIGRDVRKGHLRGYWIYTLSLEERKTCPSSCQHWQSCYGNNMPFAKRVDHTTADFLDVLEKAVDRLVSVRGRVGVLIRLHALGDFYSTHYVNFWCAMLAKHKKLSLYGYTARLSGTAIGWQVNAMNLAFPGRSMIRFSNGAGKRMNTVSIGSVASCPPHAFVCPEQTGKTNGCDSCAACWSTDKTVAFLEH